MFSRISQLECLENAIAHKSVSPGGILVDFGYVIFLLYWVWPILGLQQLD